MSNLFGNLTTEGVEEAQDRLGGFRVLESAPYTGTIKAMYVGQASASKARSVTLMFAPDEGGSEYRETFWVTNKSDENFYTKDGKKHYLPGFTAVDDICQMVTGKGLAQQVAEEKVMNVYDPDQKKEMPKSVPMLVESLGKKVTLGIIKATKNKQKKDSNGVYQDVEESRDENFVDKIFHVPSNLTVVEAKRGVTTAAFFGNWVEVNKGRTQDRRTIKDGAGGQAGKTGRPGMPPKAGESNGTKTRLVVRLRRADRC